MIGTLVVFGAGGDLTARLLLPAVAGLVAAGGLRDVRVVGVDARELSATHVTDALATHAQHVDAAARATLVAALDHRRADVTVAADVHAVLDPACADGRPVAVYLALPTQLMPAAVRHVTGYGLPAGSRIAIEKPFGHDAASARELNALLAGTPDVYRVDHALAMDVVRALPTARRAGTDEPVDWNAAHIAQLDLLWEETLALEGRASFYDRAGALRDVLQNHLVQLLCAVAATADGPTHRADVLRSVRPVDPLTDTRRARYLAGRLAGAGARTVPDYVAEPGVDPARGTETFAEVVLHLDTPRWRGTRFVLRAGKALDGRRRGVRIHPHSGPVQWLDLDAVGEAEPRAYQQIVADLLGGGSAFAVGAEETELAWDVLTPVLDAWAANAVPLTTYRAGSTGPCRAGLPNPGAGPG